MFKICNDSLLAMIIKSRSKAGVKPVTAMGRFEAIRGIPIIGCFLNFMKVCSLCCKVVIFTFDNV